LPRKLGLESNKARKAKLWWPRLKCQESVAVAMLAGFTRLHFPGKAVH